MRARVLALVEDIRTSYWFIPSLMSLAAVALSFGLTMLDGRVGAGWIEGVGWLYGNKPDGARTLLSTVAGSMIGVAGVTFSITIASVVYASGQYGPRLLTNFMGDRGNQITLGTFIATFLYCLLVLRTIRAADESPDGSTPSGDLIGEFVPHIAVVTALALVLASVAVLIFFIHHVPESIHVSNVIAGIGRDLRDKIERLFPEHLGRGVGESESERAQEALPDAFYDEAEAVVASGTGYVQGVSGDAILAVAEEADLLVRLRHRPGDFVAEGDTLALVWPPGRADASVQERIRIGYAWGRHRTAMQDTGFLFNELVEIAARALSPGVNDPFTAISCMDWLAAALKALADRDFPSGARVDGSGELRVVMTERTFEDFVTSTYGQLRPYAAADPNACLHALKTIAEVAVRCERPERLRALRREADALAQGAEVSLTLTADREAVQRRHQAVVRVIAGKVNLEEATARLDWLDGSA